MKASESPRAFPRIETKRLVLRQLEASDAEALFENYSDPEIALNFLDEPLADLKQASQFIAAFNQEFGQGQAITWAITLRKPNQMIGTCSCMLESDTCAEIGYDLGKTHWGKGLMTEALTAMIEYGFQEMGLEQIKADTFSSNARSIKLLKSLGFELSEIRADSHYFRLVKQFDENQE